MWDVKLYPFFTRNSNLVFKKHVHKTKFGEKCFWSWKNENSKNFGFQNILPFFSVSTSISAPGQWPILTGSLRQCFWVLNLLFYLLKSWRNYITDFTRFFYKYDFFHWELFFLKNIEISCILTGKVLLDNTHTMFKLVCTTPTLHQNAIFWPKSWFCGPKKGFCQFWPLRVHCVQNFCCHMGFQVIFSVGFDEDCFWVEKNLQRTL